MATRVLHVSDLHFGSRPAAVTAPAIAALIAETKPELLIASGDLAHRGRLRQIEQAAQILRSFGLPVLAVPGNHDLPYTLPGRFLHPRREFERVWGTTEPIYRSQTLLALGLDSARAWRHQSGRLSGAQIERAAELFAKAEPDVFRLVFFHHHLANAPWRSRKRPLSRRGLVLQALAQADVDLVAGGHIHQVSVCERHDFEVDADRKSIVVATAPGLGRPRPRRHGEAHGLQLYGFDGNWISVETYIWDGGELLLTAERRFPRELADG